MCLSHVVYSRPFGCDTTSLIPRYGTGKSLQCWNNIVTFRNNLVAAMLPRCIAQKIVVAKSSRVTSPLVLHEW